MDSRNGNPQFVCHHVPLGLLNGLGLLKKGVCLPKTYTWPWIRGYPHGLKCPFIFRCDTLPRRGESLVAHVFTITWSLINNLDICILTPQT